MVHNLITAVAAAITALAEQTEGAESVDNYKLIALVTQSIPGLRRIVMGALIEPVLDTIFPLLIVRAHETEAQTEGGRKQRAVTQ